jgi:hypothetical protein
MNIIQLPPLPEIRIPIGATIDPIIPDEPGPLCISDEAIQASIGNLDTPAAVAHVSIESIKEVLNLSAVFLAKHINFSSVIAGSEMPVTFQFSCLFDSQAIEVAVDPYLIIWG